MRSLAKLPLELTSVLGRRRMAGALVFRLAPAIYVAARVRRLALRPSPVVVVVGSFGKTTTSRAIRVALGLSPDVQRGTSAAFAAWHLVRGRPHTPLVLEAGIERPGQMAPAAAALKPDAVVVTSIGHEHLTSFRTLDALRAEKGQMVGAVSRSGVVFLNGDDPNVMWMKSLARGQVVTFGFGPECDVRADQPVLDWPRGMTSNVQYKGERSAVRLPLVGEHCLYSALAAIAVATTYGVRLNDALARLAGLTPAPGRLEITSTTSGALVLRDDFKSNWETMTAALDVLARIPAQRRIVILGDITEPPFPQRQSYRTLGARVGGIADRFIVVGNQFRPYRAGAIDSGMPVENVVDAGSSIKAAIDRLPHDLGEGDVVLVKGRLIQRFERIALRLAGRTVGCRLVACRAVMTSCATCPMLERGWPDSGQVSA